MGDDDAPLSSHALALYERSNSASGATDIIDGRHQPSQRGRRITEHLVEALACQYAAKEPLIISLRVSFMIAGVLFECSLPKKEEVKAGGNEDEDDQWRTTELYTHLDGVVSGIYSEVFVYVSGLSCRWTQVKGQRKGG